MSGPRRLPDGRHFIYLSNHKDQRVTARISRRHGRDVSAPCSPTSWPPVRSRGVRAQRHSRGSTVDVAAGRLTGDATVLAEGVALPGMSFVGRFSASPAMLVYMKAEELPALSELWIFDRTGKTVGTVGEAAGYTLPSLSPDGTRLAVARRELTVPARDIWVFDPRVGPGCG
jgi:hypothetical protein